MEFSTCSDKLMSFQSAKFKDIRFFSSVIAQAKPNRLKIFVASVDTTSVRKKGCCWKDSNENFYQRFFCPFFQFGCHTKKGTRIIDVYWDVIRSPSTDIWGRLAKFVHSLPHKIIFLWCSKKKKILKFMTAKRNLQRFKSFKPFKMKQTRCRQ